MNKLIATHISEDMKKENEIVMNQFIYAIMNFSDTMIGHLLINDKIYFGCMNKWQAIRWFRNHFERYGD